MPKTKKSQNTTRVAIKTKSQSLFSEIKWGESYVSLVLGAVVVVVAVLLVLAFVKNKGFNNTQETSSTATQTKTPKTYEVKQGDDLWTISQKLYGSGYNWVDLAKENNLDNPSMLYAGTKLAIPEVKPKVIIAQAQKAPTVDTANSNSIKGTSYTIQKGDSLWDISVRAYGDGYKWTEIAKANNLDNPDLIFSGNVLKLPR